MQIRIVGSSFLTISFVRMRRPVRFLRWIIVLFGRGHGVISTETWFNSSSLFGMLSLILIQRSLTFLQSTTIITVSSVFIVFTTGNTKLASTMSFVFLKCLVSINFSNSRHTSSCSYSGIGLAFCLIGLCSGYAEFLLRYLLLFNCFSINLEICWIVFHFQIGCSRHIGFYPDLEFDCFHAIHT